MTTTPDPPRRGDPHRPNPRRAGPPSGDPPSADPPRADPPRTGLRRGDPPSADSPRTGLRRGDPRRADPVSLSAYLMLALLGALQALIGSFQYSRGPAPLAAVCFDALILATCLLSGWGMQTAVGGFVPGAGWLLTAFVLASGTPSGTILITNTTAGEWFLFGGAASAAAGWLVSYLRWSNLARSARATRTGR